MAVAFARMLWLSSYGARRSGKSPHKWKKLDPLVIKLWSVDLQYAACRRLLSAGTYIWDSNLDLTWSKGMQSKKCSKSFMYHYLLKISYMQRTAAFWKSSPTWHKYLLEVCMSNFCIKATLSYVWYQTLFQPFHIWSCSCFLTNQKYNNVENMTWCWLYPLSMWSKEWLFCLWYEYMKYLKMRPM